MSKSTEEFVNEMLEAELGNHSMLVEIREKIRLGKHLSSYEERYLNVLKRQTKNEHVLELPKKTKPKITYEKIKQKEQPKQTQEKITPAINKQEKLVAKKQKEFESYQTKISSQQYLHSSKQDELAKMRTKLLNLQTQYKTIHIQTDSQRKLLDETRQHHSMDELEGEHHKLESEIESKRGEIADLKKQKQSVIQLTEQVTQKISEQQKQIADHTDFLSSHPEMLEKQRTDILEEIGQIQAKKQSQDDELQALTKERLGLESKNKELIKKGKSSLSMLEKQKQSVIQLTEQVTQKISEQQKQIADHTDFLSSHPEMLEKQRTDILEEIGQIQAKKQSQDDELQALTKEKLNLESKNKDKQGMDEQIQKHRDRLHTIQNERFLLELEIKAQMIWLDEERQKEKKIMANILQKYN